jgi:NTE family protein
VDLFVVRPSEDLGKIANQFEARLPGMFRYLTRRLGTRPARSQELLSTVLFQEDYVHSLLEIGERDGEAHAEALMQFISRPPSAEASEPERVPERRSDVWP